ncbi:MAG: pyridoxamine 5'-phosphate oxidase family protein [Pyrinomonadaceae bacterium]
MDKDIKPTKRTRIKRISKNAVYDRKVVYAILDEAFVCHVGFVADGNPVVIPTSYARVGDRMLIHGSAASRMMRALWAETDVCVNVTLIDGLVLARSVFNHSMNYRSVVVFGRAEVVSDEAEKLDALRAFSEHIVPGRWNGARQPNAKELKATLVLSISLEEASAKVRSGDPADDEEDYDLDFWAGVIPTRISAGKPQPDTRLKDCIPIPDHVLDYTRG